MVDNITSLILIAKMEKPKCLKVECWLNTSYRATQQMHKKSKAFYSSVLID